MNLEGLRRFLVEGVKRTCDPVLMAYFEGCRDAYFLSFCSNLDASGVRRKEFIRCFSDVARFGSTTGTTRTTGTWADGTAGTAGTTDAADATGDGVTSTHTIDMAGGSSVTLSKARLSFSES
eukprot:CAMPEP_0180011708 /NCGR_PEP_ID=MMETSP0984-20121128/16544_1 /TAXON_ID=483367 /ORGANISM="non described non described, Strain CCMP 2436" /LENGTH=121 /DNA_ID=CAMNT_0021933847 /DNA_START=80 /DNA_END=446 /DNA_ORIENTATION=+